VNYSLAAPPFCLLHTTRNDRRRRGHGGKGKGQKERIERASSQRQPESSVAKPFESSKARTSLCLSMGTPFLNFIYLFIYFPPHGMKFGLHLHLIRRPDWQEFYIEYHRLKDLLRRGSTETDDGNQSDASVEGTVRPAKGPSISDSIRDVEALAQTFAAELSKEMAKAESFYLGQQEACLALLARATETVALVPAAVEAASVSDCTAMTVPAAAAAAAAATAAESSVPAASTTARASDSSAPGTTAAAGPPPTPLAASISAAQAAVVAVSDFIDDLRTFSSLNCTAVEKICKKFNKKWVKGGTV
jgi:hypothetical protein